MNSFVFISFFVTVFSASLADEMYPTKYDDMDIDAILESKRMKETYINCVLDKGKCPPAGELVRQNIAEGLETECRKCSAKQIENAKKIMKYLYEEDKETLKLLAEKYDPDGKYIERATEYLKTHTL